MTVQTKQTPTKRNKLQPQSQPTAKAYQLKPLAPTQAIEPAVLLQRAMTDSAKLVPAEVLSLQRIVGNRVVSRLIQAQRQTNPPQGGPRNVVQLKLFQSYSDALKQQVKDVSALDAAITEGLQQNQDRRLKNSCEWVRQGTPGKRIYAQTPTHDSFKRARAAGEALGTIAVFPKFGGGGHMYDAGNLKPAQTYDKNVNNNDNIYFEDEGVFSRTAGLQSPGDGVSIIRAASQGKAKIWETLKHEVQHAADFHGGGRKEADQWYEGFKTEFRAYSLEGSELKNLSMTKQVKKKGYTWTERQYAIFSHIYSGYPHTQKGWDQNPQLTDGRSFRQAVVDFKLPYSPNPQNSIRVDKFLTYLHELHADTFQAIEKAKVPENNLIVRQTKQRMADLMAAINDLDAVERRIILSNPAIKFENHLVDLVGAKGSPTEELPPDYVPLVEKTGEKQDDYVEFLLNGMGKFYWAKETDLEEYQYGHLFGRETQKLIVFADPPPAKIAYLYDNPLLSKAYTQVTTALRQGAAAKLPPPEEIFG